MECYFTPCCSFVAIDAVFECEGLDEIYCPTKCNSQSCEDYLNNGEPNKLYCVAQMIICLVLKPPQKCGCLVGGTKSQWMGHYSACIPKEQCGCVVEDEYVKVSIA